MDKSSGAKLGISTCIVLFVVGAAASENGVCTASAEVCGHLGTQNAIERIFDWWDSVSVMKPLKCRDPLATSEIEEEDINPVTQEFTVEKCKESDSRQTLYGSKGFIEDEEGMLSGSGRLVRKPPG